MSTIIINILIVRVFGNCIYISEREKGKYVISLSLDDNIICEPQTAEVIKVQRLIRISFFLRNEKTIFK